MNRNTVRVMSLCVFVLSACGSMPSSDVQSIRILSKGTPTGTMTDCPESSGNRCVVTVSVAPDGMNNCSGALVTLSPDFPKLGDGNKHKRVEFVLAQGGRYKFCPKAGDGAFFEATDPPFDLETNTKCEDYFIWKRSKDPDTVTYAYMLRFRDVLNNVACIKDPWIKNG